MERVLYKAKRKDNGKWVKGYFVKKRFNTHLDGYMMIDTEGINYDEFDYYEPSFISFEIDETTICQYTGLNDKNGNMIWENDILISREPYIPTIPFSVRFNCKTLAYVGFYDEYNKEFPLNADLLSSCEVIGNIFDNKTK